MKKIALALISLFVLSAFVVGCNTTAQTPTPSPTATPTPVV